MKKTFFKNLFRDIKKTLSRFLSIVIIIAVGVAFYAGVRATSPDMKKSGDYYFNKNNLMDFKLISTLGITKDNLSEVEKLKGVTKAIGSYSIDAVIQKDKHSLVLNINSLPDENGINKIRLVKGRRAENNSEAVVEERFLEANNFKIGDTIVLQSGNDSKIEDSLKNNKFKIVGAAESPLYVSAQRQLSSVGNGSVKGFVYIMADVFKSDVYTEAYIRTDSNESKNSLLDNENYKDFTSNIEKSLKEFGIKQGEQRYSEILKTAQDKINEAENKLNSSKVQAADKFADGYSKLNKASNDLIKGKEELNKNKAIFYEKMADGEQQISYGRAQIASQEKLLLAGASQLTAAQLAASKAEIEASKKKLDAAQEQLNIARQEGLKKLSDGEKKLEDGQKNIDENTKKLKDEEIKVNAQLKDGETEIQKSRDKLKSIKKPDFYVLGRSANVGYESYRQDSDRIDNIGKAFPLIFFLVAALVSLTTMTRMVQENRVEIGTFKALGYSRASIVSHYLIYSLFASLIGSIVGISFGFRLFPPLIMNAYSSLYTIPDSLTPFNTKLALEASFIAILFTTIAAVAATLEELREVPATLMRPKVPKSGKVILLEKVTFLWKRLSFTTKVTARNIFRYKQRFFMTVIGIAACTGLMITGFGLKTGISGSVEKQFSDIYRYDMQTTLSKGVDESEKKEINDKVMKDSNIKSILFYYTKNSEVKKSNSGKEDAYLVIPEKKEDLNKYINLTIKGKDLNLSDNGVIITEKLSKLTGKKVGDIIEITVNDKVVKANISAITEQYVQHYIYMSPLYYQKLTGEKPKFDGFYGLLKNTSDSPENNTSKTLTSIKGINSVSFKNNMHIDYNKSIKSINTVVLVLIASAGVLAFVVIYNLTNINISERERELATIKLLGFYNNELASYIYRENIILTIIGSFTGIGVGMLLDNFVINTAETNIMMFLKTIDPIYFLYSILLTVVFSVVVNLAMYGRFDKIDMIDSLKNAE